MKSLFITNFSYLLYIIVVFGLFQLAYTQGGGGGASGGASGGAAGINQFTIEKPINIKVVPAKMNKLTLDDLDQIKMEVFHDVNIDLILY